MTTYALRYRDNHPSSHCTLVELTPAQVKLLGNHDTFVDGVWCYQFYAASQAHQWVRDGGHHETYLWVDAGRIRRSVEA